MFLPKVHIRLNRFASLAYCPFRMHKMAYLGKVFTLDKQENFEGFLDSVGKIPEEMKKAIMNSKPINKLEKNGDTYTLTASRPDGAMSTSNFKSGDESDENYNGITFKNKLTVEGDNITQLITFPDGGVLTLKREFSPNELKVTLTSNKWDGVSYRYYKA